MEILGRPFVLGLTLTLTVEAVKPLTQPGDTRPIVHRTITNGQYWRVYKISGMIL